MHLCKKNLKKQQHFKTIYKLLEELLSIECIVHHNNAMSLDHIIYMMNSKEKFKRLTAL